MCVWRIPRQEERERGRSKRDVECARSVWPRFSVPSACDVFFFFFLASRFRLGIFDAARTRSIGSPCARIPLLLVGIILNVDHSSHVAGPPRETSASSSDVQRAPFHRPFSSLRYLGLGVQARRRWQVKEKGATDTTGTAKNMATAATPGCLQCRRSDTGHCWRCVPGPQSKAASPTAAKRLHPQPSHDGASRPQKAPSPPQQQQQQQQQRGKQARSRPAKSAQPPSPPSPRRQHRQASSAKARSNAAQAGHALPAAADAQARPVGPTAGAPHASLVVHAFVGSAGAATTTSPKVVRTVEAKKTSERPAPRKTRDERTERTDPSVTSASPTVAETVQAHGLDRYTVRADKDRGDARGTELVCALLPPHVRWQRDWHNARAGDARSTPSASSPSGGSSSDIAITTAKVGDPDARPCKTTIPPLQIADKGAAPVPPTLVLPDEGSFLLAPRMRLSAPPPMPSTIRKTNFKDHDRPLAAAAAVTTTTTTTSTSGAPSCLATKRLSPKAQAFYPGAAGGGGAAAAEKRPAGRRAGARSKSNSENGGSESSADSGSANGVMRNARRGKGDRGGALQDVRGAINFAKSVLIGRYVQPRCTVMDLGCGRGQDVPKLAYSRPRYVLFVDIADRALCEAERRWRRGRFAYPAAFLQDDFCAPTRFLAGRRVAVHCDDPKREPGQPHRAVVDHLVDTVDGVDLVDAVSCQFAAHCAFWSPAAARAFVANVRRVLRPGGVFLGIVPDGARVWDLLSKPSCLTPSDAQVPEHGSESVGGTRTETDVAHEAGAKRLCLQLVSDVGAIESLCRDAGHDAQHLVEKATKDNIDDGGASDGRSFVPYLFDVGRRQQDDAGGAERSESTGSDDGRSADCGPMDARLQYTMMFDDLRDMCVEAGLKCIMSTDLASFFDTESINPRNAAMMERMGAPVQVRDPDDRQHLGVYRVFVFVRAPCFDAPEPAGRTRNQDAIRPPAKESNDTRSESPNAAPAVPVQASTRPSMPPDREKKSRRPRQGRTASEERGADAAGASESSNDRNDGVKAPIADRLPTQMAWSEQKPSCLPTSTENGGRAHQTDCDVEDTRQAPPVRPSNENANEDADKDEDEDGSIDTGSGDDGSVKGDAQERDQQRSACAISVVWSSGITRSAN